MNAIVNADFQVVDVVEACIQRVVRVWRAKEYDLSIHDIEQSGIHSAVKGDAE